MSVPKLAFRGVGMSYGGLRRVEALRGADLEVQEGEFVCLLGPSGCGKSTLLHLAAGFLFPTEGSVLVDGRPVSGPGVDRGVVFQQHTLFPWATAAENAGFGPRMRGLAPREVSARADRALAEVGLSDFAAHYPSELSMGMQQRVGLARAFANDPEILLMDEPFASLDALTRYQMQNLLISLWEKRRQTVVFVTHDIEEALLLGDRVVVLSRRPASVLRDCAVDLGPRPHRLRQPGFGPLRAELQSLL